MTGAVFVPSFVEGEGQVVKFCPGLIYIPLGQAGGRDRIAGVNRRWCSEQFVTERPCSRFREKPASQILQFEGHERLRVLSPWVNAVFGMVLGIRKVWHQKGTVRERNPSDLGARENVASEGWTCITGSLDPLKNHCIVSGFFISKTMSTIFIMVLEV